MTTSAADATPGPAGTPTGTPIGIITVSDRAATGAYADLSGPAIIESLTRWIEAPWHPVVRLVPDEQAQIEAALVELADTVGCHLVVTTGGTGPAARDVTPEATTAVCSRMLPGFGEQMRAVSLRTVRTAVLSRQTAGIRNATLIVNLPGKPAAIDVCLGAILDAIPPCVKLLGGPTLTLTPEARARPF
ncbi:MAG: molybdopterin adenylyltransferase [Gemmatimonadaceae bacterium]